MFILSALFEKISFVHVHVFRIGKTSYDVLIFTSNHNGGEMFEVNG